MNGVHFGVHQDQVSLSIFDESQTCPKYPKKQVCQIFAIYKEKVSQPFFFWSYFDAKYSDTLRGSKLTNVNLIIIGWAWSKMGKTFRSHMI